MSKITRIIKDELTKYPIHYDFDRTSEHPCVVLTLPNGSTRTIHFNKNPNDHSILTTKLQIKRLMREQGIEPTKHRDGALGEKIIEAVERVAVPPPPTMKPETPPMSAPLNGNGHHVNVSTQPRTAEPKEMKSQLSQGEVVTVARLICMNATIDSDKKLVTYKDGWSDERILKMIQAQPGRGHLKAHTISELRRREIGRLPGERERGAMPLRASGVAVVNLSKRIDALEARLAALEGAVLGPTEGR